MTVRWAAAQVASLVIGASPLAAAPRPVEWSFRASANGGYTSEAFPGYTASTPDRFGQFSGGGGLRVRPLAGLRIEWLSSVSIFRF